MSPVHKARNLAEQYDQALAHARNARLPEDVRRPLPTSHWPKDNLQLLERYRDWLVEGGTSQFVTDTYHMIVAGHVLGLALKPADQLDLEADLERVLEYIKAKKLSREWTRNCKNSLIKFRRFLRLERGLGEEQKARSFDVAAHTEGLPAWLVSELERYQRTQERNWRPSRLLQTTRRFWTGHLNLWRFLCGERAVKVLEDVKRQHVLDYMDQRLRAGRAVATVNYELHIFHSFLIFLQDEGYPVPQTLLRIASLKQPDSLPRFLTDEQVRRLRDDLEGRVAEAGLLSKRRDRLLDRAAFYLLWQGGLRVAEIEEMRLEDLNLGQKQLTVRDGKGRKDRTVYLADSAVLAVREYLAVRGSGGVDHVFLYRSVPLSVNLIRLRIQAGGQRIGVKVDPHRLRHTCATQLLNAGCRITSIQKFLGHKKLNTTMIYARAHDQTVAEDYFTAMERVEQRLDIGGEHKEYEVVKVHAPERLLQIIDQLQLHNLRLQERLGIVKQLREVFDWDQDHPLPENGIVEGAASTCKTVH